MRARLCACVREFATPCAMAKQVSALPGWQALSDVVRDAIIRADVSESHVFCGLCDGTEEGFMGLAADLGGTEADVCALQALWKEASPFAKRYIHVSSQFSCTHASVVNILREREESRKRSFAVMTQVPATLVSKTSRARKWPTKLRRRLASASGPNARAQAEAEERERWLVELKYFIQAANLPIVRAAEQAIYSDAIWGGIGSGLRARTLRRRVRDWRVIARYF